MERFVTDLRHSLRALARSRGLALGAAFAIALGIGATTTLFSIVHGATRALPFNDADELLILARTYERVGLDNVQPFAFDYHAWSEQQTSFEGLAAFSPRAMNLGDAELAPQRASGVEITPNAFDLLGVRPFRGRAFNSEDARPGAPAAVLLGYDLWRTRYASDPAVIGRAIRVDGQPRTVIGIMPPEFRFPINEQLWVPLSPNASAAPNQGEQFHVFARLRDDRSIEQAGVEMDGVAARLGSAWPDTHEGRGVRVMPFTEMEMDPAMTIVLYLMLLAVSFVLVIACVNVANLLLARAATRTRDVAIRAALGASRRRIALQHLLESALIALLGGAVGLLLAFAGVRFFDAATAGILEAFWIDFRIDTTVLLFATLLVGFAAVLAGLLPALRASRTSVSAVLKADAGAGSLRIGRLSRALVVAELALACGLLAISMLLVRAAIGLRTVPWPFPTQEIFTAELSLQPETLGDDAARETLLRELSDRLGALPGVRGAALVSTLPGRGAGNWSFMPDATRPLAPEQRPYTGVVMVTPEFFELVDASPLRGRSLSWADRAGAPLVGVVNESWVRRFSPDRDPIGQAFALAEGAPIAIVGIVPDRQLQDPEDTQGDGIYLPMLQHRPFSVRIMAHAAGDPLALAPLVQAAVQAFDPDLPVFGSATLHQAIYADKRVLDAFGTLFGIFGGAALFLTLIGLYGVVSFGVVQRTREIGVRMALGARRVEILGLIFVQGVRPLALGVGIGLLLAFALARGLASAIDFIDPGDPLIALTLAAVLLLTAIIALLVPARRAAAVEPLRALRHE